MEPDYSHEVVRLREVIATAALAIFASAARLRRKGEINEAREMERVAVDLHGAVKTQKEEAADERKSD